MRSAVYVGTLAHGRHAPRPHHFSYRLFLVYVDLDELEEACACSRLWSLERWNIASFRRKHYLGPVSMPLREAVRARVARETGHAPPEGPIGVLTQPAVFGYCFNPVTFYYLFEADGETLHSIVAEITNTPWKERHQYVLAASDAHPGGEWWEWRFDKRFHVSPFFGMDHEYVWRFTAPQSGSGARLAVAMTNHAQPDGQRVFDASLELTRRDWTRSELRRVLLRHPWMTAKVHAAIYWQAFRLWLKRAPFHAHPASSRKARPRA